jgi:hypothetical protein
MLQISKGMGIIDVIIGVALVLIIFLALFGVLRASLSLSALAKAKTTAVELANTQMEYLRGLSYDSLGTVGGIPSGLIPQTSTTAIDGIAYSVRTFIAYYDDPADGKGTQDTNGITIDYKTAKVTVSYSLGGLLKSIGLLSNFVPPGVESSTGGGTLSIHVVDAASANVVDANVRIVNTSVSPAVDFTTFTNTSGYAVIGGASTSSEYQIYVSRTGYSSAQTYARTAQNVNPAPGYLTVSKDQVTGGTFFIDRLSAIMISSFSPAETVVDSDSFADSSGLASQSGTRVAGGSLTLAIEELAGSARSITIVPNYLKGWGILSATLSSPAGTTAVVKVADAGGTFIPESVLSGNALGFTSFPVSLTSIPVSSFPALSFVAELTSNSTTTAPEILDWSVSHTDGPTPLPNAQFILTGAKTIGTDANSAPIYKTVVSDTTGASAEKTKTLEWDSYSMVLGSGNLIESCPASPYLLTPANTTDAVLLAGALTTNTLPVVVKDNLGNAVSGAKIVLTKSGYAATVPTSSCGLAFFNGLTSGTYSAIISASGHATMTFPNINVAGHTSATVLTLP